MRPIVTALFGLLLTAPLSAADSPDGQIMAQRVIGKVHDQRGDTIFELHNGDTIKPQDTITTDDKSSVVILFSNGAATQLGAQSELSIEKFLQDPFQDAIKLADLTEEPTVSTTKLKLNRGELVGVVKHLKHDQGSSFEIETPIGAAGIRGTTFSVSYYAAPDASSFSRLFVSTTEGLVSVTDRARNAFPAAVGKRVEIRAARVANRPPRQRTVDLPVAAQRYIRQQAQAVEKAKRLTIFKKPAPATKPETAKSAATTPEAPAPAKTNEADEKKSETSKSGKTNDAADNKKSDTPKPAIAPEPKKSAAPAKTPPATKDRKKESK